jgi:hypothetical protein
LWSSGQEIGKISVRQVFHRRGGDYCCGIPKIAQQSLARGGILPESHTKEFLYQLTMIIKQNLLRANSRCKYKNANNIKIHFIQLPYTVVGATRRLLAQTTTAPFFLIG